MQKRKHIIFAVTVLVLALVFGAAVSPAVNPGFGFAASNAQEAEGTVPAGEVQAEMAQVTPGEETLNRLYQQAAPSVVNIEVTSSRQARSSIPGLPFDLPDDEMPESPVQGQGTGFVYDDQGHIVTNNHVVEDAESITVYFNNGMWAEAEVVAMDAASDLAVLQVEAPEGVEMQPLPLASSNSLNVGRFVAAVGSPFGLDETMTFGIVSALGRSFPTDQTGTGGAYSLPDVIQTDAAINPGNSGGPLLNLQGEVVGVNFAINSPVRANSGVGFAIPVSVVQKIIPALIENGEFNYAYLGIAGGTVNARLAEEEGLEPNILGIFVANVVSGGPSEEGDVQEGDIITAINNEPVTRFEDLISYLFREVNPGDTVTLTVLRDGEEQTLDVTVSERPSEDEMAGQEGSQEMEISISEAINTARDAVEEAGLMGEIDSADAQAETVQGRPVWVVTLTAGERTAQVIIDGLNGEVLDLSME